MAEKKKGKVGHPIEKDYDFLINDADAWLEDCYKNKKLPHINRYAREHGITRQYLYELATNLSAKGDKRLSDTIKKISAAKEEVLESRALDGDYNSTMAIFSLKQLGWKDRVEANVEDNRKVNDILDSLNRIAGDR